jgi:hypothetical protein
VTASAWTTDLRVAIAGSWSLKGLLSRDVTGSILIIEDIDAIEFADPYPAYTASLNHGRNDCLQAN